MRCYTSLVARRIAESSGMDYVEIQLKGLQSVNGSNGATFNQWVDGLMTLVNEEQRDVHDFVSRHKSYLLQKPKIANEI